MSENADDGSDDADEFDVELIAELSEQLDEQLTAMKRVIVSEDEDADILEVAEDLWEVLDEIEDALGTIDGEELPDAIDLDDLPEAVDVEDVPEGMVDEDETAIELTNVREAVNLRELWDTVDLTQLYQEKQDFEDEVDELEDDFNGDEDGEEGLIDDDGLFDDEEDEELLDVDNVVGTEGAHVQFDAQARQAFLEEKIQDAVEKFRSALLSTHDMLREVYRTNQEKLGQPGRQPDSLNPTAASTMPSGPIPDSASLRSSTVPEEVKYSKVKNPRRIYGRRFTKATKDAARAETTADEEDEETAEESDDETDEADEASEESAESAEESAESADESTESAEEASELTIEVNDHDE